MKKVIPAIILALIALCRPACAIGQLTVSEAFVSAPTSVFPLLDDMTRLDMLDYFNSAMTTASTNSLEGQSRITLLEPRKAMIEMTNSSVYELDLLLTSKSDTLITVISTVSTPAHDSQLAVYSSDWSKNVTDQVFEKPSLDDWLTTDGKANRGDVEALVPFLLIGYTFDPESEILVLTNNTKEFLSTDIYDIVAPFLNQQLKYKWNGKKFVAAQ